MMRDESNTVHWSLAHSLALAAFLAATASNAAAQQAPAPVVAAARPDSAQVQLTPARPTQGSIVRITIRPAAPAESRRDSLTGANIARRDSLTSATIARRDSLTGAGNARRDSLTDADSLRLESLRQDILRLDSLLADSVRTDALAVTSARADSTRPVPTDSVTVVLIPRRAYGTALMDSAGSAADSMTNRVAAIRGTLFGEPLHFHEADSGSYFAIGGIPVDAPRTVRVPLTIERIGGVVDTMDVQLDIERTAYRMEKLTVAPKFGQAPNPALAARIAREQALASAVSRRSHETPRLWTGDFSRPREARVTSRFGDGRQFNGAIQSRHMGLDLAGAVGAPVLAPDRGVVALIGDFYYAGNAVYIDHGAGLVTAYFHLSAVDVAQGDTVSAGDRIGRVGATGRVTGPHLHWVARYGAVTVDPSTLLDIGPVREE